MPAVVEVEPHDHVARIEHGRVGGLIGLRAGVGLHIGVFGVEEFLGAIASQVFHDVGEFAPAVVALAGISFGILVGENAAGRFQYRFRREILAGDQFDLRVLAFGFAVDRIIDFRVNL